MWAVLMAMVQFADAGACARSCVASGAEPRWSIRDEEGRWSLHIAGQPAASLVPGDWHDTPAGRRLTGTVANGRFTLLATFGACGDPHERMAKRSSHFATLTLQDGRVLRGCMSGRGVAY